MTAPSPAGLSPLLDQLDEALAEGTPGPWREGAQPYVYAEVPDGMPVVADCYADADAALIVAAVNAVGPLVAALRAVEALADELDQELADRGVLLDRVVRPGDRLRSTLTAALTPGADTAGATA